MRFASTRDARAQGIVAIFQELSLTPNLTVAENVFLGREPRNALGLIDFEAMSRATRALLERLNLDVAPRDAACGLRVGQQQLVEIARALSVNARVLYSG